MAAVLVALAGAGAAPHRLGRRAGCRPAREDDRDGAARRCPRLARPRVPSSARRASRAPLDAWLLSAWQGDPFARGGYAYARVGHEDGADRLARPIEDTLYIAGEATHQAHAGTVHGAIETGERAALQILSVLGAATA